MFASKPAYRIIVRFAERMGMVNRHHCSTARTHF